MGDGADDAIDRMFDELDDCEQEELYDDYSPSVPPVFSRAPRAIVCRVCGTGGLRWRYVDGRWQLVSGNRLHACPIELQSRRQ